MSASALGALSELYMEAYLAWRVGLSPPCVRNKRDNLDVKLWRRISINSQYTYGAQFRCVRKFEIVYGVM